MVDSDTITFLRFFIGVVFLGVFIFYKRKQFIWGVPYKIILLAAIAKGCNYYFENIAISLGHSYGNILVPPVQTVVLLLVGVIFLKESVTWRARIGGALCVVGVSLISWNGLSIDVLLESNLLITLLFILAGMGAAFHVLGQKMLLNKMDPLEMNFTIFFWATLITAIPLPGRVEIGTVGAAPILALLALGFITAMSFYLFSIALKSINFTIAVILSNSSVLFTILWGKLFMNEPITTYIVAGTVLFLIGILALNLPVRKRKVLKETIAS